MISALSRWLAWLTCDAYGKHRLEIGVLDGMLLLRKRGETRRLGDLANQLAYPLIECPHQRAGIWRSLPQVLKEARREKTS